VLLVLYYVDIRSEHGSVANRLKGRMSKIILLDLKHMWKT